MQQTQFIWSGHYYLKGDEKIELTFKDFSCPEEGGPIIGHTADNRTAKGTIQSNRQVDFTLEGTNGESILYFQGKLGKDEDLIVGNYGVEEGEHDKHFKLFRKTKEVVLQKCFGHYMKSEKKIELTFQDFKCPTEGGTITGRTIDGKTLKGTIKSDRKLSFTLKAINGDQTLYFEGQLTKDKKSIVGSYGTEENETPDAFKLFIEEVLSRWSGYQMKDDKKIELVFKSFSCPTEGGTITGQTIDGKKVKGTIKSDRKLNFTLVAKNGDQTLYFEGQLTIDKKSIVGSYGTEENETPDAFKLFLKEINSKEEVFQKWSGHYLKDGKKIELVFKSFSCPTEGGIITGLTNDGRKANGRNDQKLAFSLEAANRERKLYFWGSFTKDKSTIVGDWGVEQEEADGQFKITKEEQEVIIWAGYYLQSQKRVSLNFKDFICPIEGGVITGHTLDEKTVQGNLQKNKKFYFTLKANNGDSTLHFWGSYNERIKMLVGDWGVEQEESDGQFKIYIKDENLIKIKEKWTGFYKRDLDNGLKSAMKIQLKLKSFGYSFEIGLVKGETEDGLHLKGSINNDFKIEFTIKNQKRRLTIFFQGQMKEDKKSIKGTYGFSEDAKEGEFELCKEEEIPNQPACVCNCFKCRKALSVGTIQLDNWRCDVCNLVKAKGSQFYKCDPDKWGCCQTCAQAIAKGNCICGKCGSSVEKSKFEYQNGKTLCNVCKEVVPSGSDVYHCTDNWDCCVSCFEVQFQGKQPKTKPQPKPTDSDEKKKVCPCGRCGQLLQISTCYLDGTITCDVCYGDIQQGSQEFQCREDNWDICLSCANAKNGGNQPNPEDPQPYPVQPKPQPDYPVTIPEGNRNQSSEIAQAIAYVDRIISAGQRWTDQKFPPEFSSLANSQDSHNDIQRMRQYVGSWKRASEMFKGISLFGDKIDPSDVHQGGVGDCYFLATLSALAEEPARVKARFYTKERNQAGIYLMFFFINGKETPVYVDDHIPVMAYGYVQQGEFAAKCQNNKLWVVLMEKAWAKLCGTYARSSGGQCGTAAEHIIGVTSEVIEHSNWQINTNSIWPKFKEADRRKFVMMAGTSGQGERGNSKGILSGHAYTVLSVHEAQNYKLVRIRNPHGEGEWKGAFSDRSNLWNAALKKEVGYIDDENDGIFFMPFQDFLDQFRLTWFCLDDDICGKDVHSNIEHQFRYNEQVSFQFELHQEINVENSMFIISCIQQGPRLEYERKKSMYSRSFDPARFRVTMMNKDRRKILDTQTKADYCINPSCVVKKEQGIIYPGTYTIQVTPQWNGSESSYPDFKKILFDIYCPEVLTIIKLSY